MRRHLKRGAAAGAIGGFLGAWAMNRFDQLWSLGARGRPAAPNVETRIAQSAAALLGRAIQHPLTPAQKAAGGTAIHYLFGTLMGAAYGAVASRWPPAAAGRGGAFAVLLWLGGDEWGAPALGLSNRPDGYPPATHARALGEHLVYGLLLDSIRRRV